MESNFQGQSRSANVHQDQDQGIRHSCRSGNCSCIVPNKFPRSSVFNGPDVGQGAFGSVIKGKLENMNIVVKMLHAPIGQSKYAVLQEMFNLSHRNLVQFMGFVDTDPTECPRLIFRQANTGSLLDYLRDQARPTCGATLLKIISDIVNGMEYLHEMNFIHGSLAARNILLDGLRGKPVNAKISDYGMIRVINGMGPNYFNAQGAKTIPIRWMPKESLQKIEKNPGETVKPSDVWSFGVLLWEMATMGEIPYGPGVSNTEVKQHITNGSSPLTFHRPDSCPPRVLNIMENILVVNPGQRPTFLDLKRLIDSDASFQNQMRQTKGSEFRSEPKKFEQERGGFHQNRGGSRGRGGRGQGPRGGGRGRPGYEHGPRHGDFSDANVNQKHYHDRSYRPPERPEERTYRYPERPVNKPYPGPEDKICRHPERPGDKICRHPERPGDKNYRHIERPGDKTYLHPKRTEDKPNMCTQETQVLDKSHSREDNGYTRNETQTHRRPEWNKAKLNESSNFKPRENRNQSRQDARKPGANCPQIDSNVNAKYDHDQATATNKTRHYVFSTFANKSYNLMDQRASNKVSQTSQQTPQLPQFGDDLMSFLDFPAPPPPYSEIAIDFTPTPLTSSKVDNPDYHMNKNPNANSPSPVFSGEQTDELKKTVQELQEKIAMMELEQRRKEMKEQSKNPVPLTAPVFNVEQSGDHLVFHHHHIRSNSQAQSGPNSTSGMTSTVANKRSEKDQCVVV